MTFATCRGMDIMIPLMPEDAEPWLLASGRCERALAVATVFATLLPFPAGPAQKRLSWEGLALRKPHPITVPFIAASR